MGLKCKDCGADDLEAIMGGRCCDCHRDASEKWRVKMAVRQDASQFDPQNLVNNILSQHWMHECRIDPAYIPPFPRTEIDMTPTQEVTAEAAVGSLHELDQMERGRHTPTGTAYWELSRHVLAYVSQSAAKIAELTQLVTDTRNAGTEKHNRLVEAQVEIERLREALELRWVEREPDRTVSSWDCYLGPINVGSVDNLSGQGYILIRWGVGVNIPRQDISTERLGGNDHDGVRKVIEAAKLQASEAFAALQGGQDAG